MTPTQQKRFIRFGYGAGWASGITWALSGTLLGVFSSHLMGKGLPAGGGGFGTFYSSPFSSAPFMT